LLGLFFASYSATSATTTAVDYNRGSLFNVAAETDFNNIIGYYNTDTSGIYALPQANSVTSA